MNNIVSNITQKIKENFRFGTLNFIFIIVYVNIFQLIFGPENSIVGVIFAIMMSASMVRDLTATPFRHLLSQSFVLIWMALAAYWVMTLPAPLSFFLNFITLLVILYAFTYEYVSHRYFPYILSYLFLLFITPVTDASMLPKRLLGMVAGAVSIILYQWFMGRKRVEETAQDVLSEMTDDIKRFISYKLKDRKEHPDLSDIRRKLCSLSQIVYERRKKALCISDASFSLISAGRGLEHLLILIYELPEDLSAQEKILLKNIDRQLSLFRSYLQQEITDLPCIEVSDFSFIENEKASSLFYKTMLYCRDRLIHMTDPENKNHYRKTALSFKIQLQAALDLSPVRAIYSIRAALILSCAVLIVQLLSLPHGKWLLFTIASVSLPYADDIPAKMKKRILATIIGGLISVAFYSVIPSSAGRTAAMMLSGYISFYLTDYAGTFACSTIGALGGAVYVNAFGFQEVGYIFMIRMGYILAGVCIAYLFNCVIFPYKRTVATKQLWKKYKSITELLTKICQEEQIDLQLYYSTVIQAHLLEEKLTQNAHLEKWTDFPDLLADCREQIRNAHRKLIIGRSDAPVFDSGHLC